MSVERTGRIRYRRGVEQQGRHAYTVLVVQVEERYSEMRLLGGWPDRVEGVRWRDAQIEDLQPLTGVAT